MNIDLALSLLIALLNNTNQIGQMINNAKASGRTTLTPEEWDQIVHDNNNARQLLASLVQE